MTREVGDRFKRYDEQAAADDRRMRRVDARSITGSFEKLGDGLTTAVRSIIADGAEPKLKDAAAPIHLALELAIQRAGKRAAFLGLSGPGLESACQRGATAVWKHQELCESPIERRLLPWLVFQDYGPLLTFPAVIHNAKDEKEVPKGDIMIVPQFAFAKFRLDFGVVARWKQQTKIVAVECDGASFHGAKRDAWRDRYLRSWGIETVRASGEEIFNHPSGVSARAGALIADWAVQL